MFDAKNVEVTETGPKLRDRSTEALRPRSALSGAGSTSLARPAASVSSVSGVGAKKPCPAEMRLVQPDLRKSAESRGLKNVPYTFWKSTLALADILTQGASSISSCAKIPGAT